jgi:uncharacterized protein YukJ
VEEGGMVLLYAEQFITVQKLFITDCMYSDENKNAAWIERDATSEKYTQNFVISSEGSSSGKLVATSY